VANNSKRAMGWGNSRGYALPHNPHKGPGLTRRDLHGGRGLYPHRQGQRHWRQMLRPGRPQLQRSRGLQLA
jgi:hypothetical protein